MRVALVIAGHYRSFEQGHISLKSAILDPLNPDIYIASWNQADFMGGRTINYDKRIVSEDFTKFIGGYNIKKIRIFDEEEGIKASAAEFLKSRWPNHRKAHYIKTTKQFLIIKKGVELVGQKPYDVIIRARPDNVYTGRLHHSELRLMNECKAPKPIRKHLRLNDWFFMIPGDRRQVLTALFGKKIVGRLHPEIIISKSLDEARMKITHLGPGLKVKVLKGRHHVR